jgi:hypothetical protein
MGLVTADTEAIGKLDHSRGVAQMPPPNPTINQ